jgi:hypothetical protein
MKKNILIATFLFICSTVIGQDYTSASIIGKPFKLVGLEVAQNDFPKEMTWISAENACNSLGKGWRLPTKEELDKIWISLAKKKRGGFSSKIYWSSTLKSDVYAWVQDFDLEYGQGRKDFASNRESYTCAVRAVRTLKK